MMKRVANIVHLLSIIFVFSLPCMAMHYEPDEDQHPLSTSNTLKKDEEFNTFIPSHYVRVLQDLYEKENQLKNTRTYFCLSASHSVISVFYNSEHVVFRAFCAGIPFIKNYIAPYLPQRAQPLFQVALDELSHQFEILRFCEYTKRYVAEKILGYTSLLLMNTLSSDDRSYPYNEELEAAVYYFAKAAGWYKADMIQASLNHLWNQPLNFGAMGQEIGETPRNISTCGDYSMKKWDLDYCAVFYTQEALNQKVAGITQEIYEDINTRGLWKYPSPPYEFGNLYKIESPYWVSEKVCQSPTSCQQFFRVKNPSNYAVALVDLFHSKAEIDCRLAQQFVEQLTLLKLLGPVELNALYQQTPQHKQFIFPAARHEKPFGFLFLPDSKRELGDPPTVGSFTYLRNHDVYPLIHTGFYQGYNLAVVGKDRYMGFGPDFPYPLSYGEVKEIFYKETNKSPTSTLLQESIIEELFDKVGETIKNREYFENYVDDINYEYWNTFTSAMQISLGEFNRIRQNFETSSEDPFNSLDLFFNMLQSLHRQNPLPLHEKVEHSYMPDEYLDKM